MNFLSPAAFWFAAVLPVVVVFYLLKRRRVAKLVPSTLLWQKFLAESQANAPFQKLRHNWLLLLQLLLLVLVILALSRPFFSGHNKLSQMRIVILDASASMQSADESPSRFEKARSEALKWVDSMRDEDQMLVLQAGAQTEVKQSPSSNKAELRRAILACSVTDSTTHLNEALRLAETLLRDRKDAEVHLFSDGAGVDLSDFENKGLQLIFHSFGQRSENQGIISLDIRSNPENPQQRAIYTSVANYSANPKQLELELLFGGEVVEVRPLTLKPGETVPQVFLKEQSRDGVFTVRINPRDDLAADNQASMVSQLPMPVKVLLVTKGNHFLEKALRAAPNVQLRVVDQLNQVPEGVDLVALDDVIPLVWPKENLLAVHVANTNWFEEWTKVETPAIVDWKTTHPLLRYVNLDNVLIRESLAVKLPRWANSLVDAQQTPLILAGEIDQHKVLWIGFDVAESNWPLRFSFPIFMANAAEWLNPAAEKANHLQLRPGSPFRQVVATNLPVTVQFPDGHSQKVVLDPGARELVFGDTRKQGTYTLRVGTNETAFCVNLLDSGESNTKPKTELPLGRIAQVNASQVKRAYLELWRWIALAGLGVLLLEWWYYHRRTV